MSKIKVTLEFDEKDLGEKWMNRDNLELLIYSNMYTREDLLKVIEYEELS